MAAMYGTEAPSQFLVPYGMMTAHSFVCLGPLFGFAFNLLLTAGALCSTMYSTAHLRQVQADSIACLETARSSTQVAQFVYMYTTCVCVLCLTTWNADMQL